MRTWTALDKKCYICGIKEGEQYPFVVTEPETSEKKVGVDVQIVEISRKFNKNNEAVYSVCTRCQLLYILDDEGEFFRYDFPEGELKPTKEELINKGLEESIKRIDETNKKLEVMNEKLSILQKGFAEQKKEEVKPEE